MQVSPVTQKYFQMKKYKFLGFGDDVCDCEICGKQELKGTYALQDNETGDIVRAGRVCGAKMLGYSTKEFVVKFKTQKEEDKANAHKELHSSDEYKAYRHAIDFLNKEADDICIAVCNESNEEKRKAIREKERSLESRMSYIKPFSTAMEAKRKELQLKYNLKYVN